MELQNPVSSSVIARYGALVLSNKLKISKASNYYFGVYLDDEQNENLIHVVPLNRSTLPEIASILYHHQKNWSHALSDAAHYLNALINDPVSKDDLHPGDQTSGSLRLISVSLQFLQACRAVDNLLQTYPKLPYTSLASEFPIITPPLSYQDFLKSAGWGRFSMLEFPNTMRLDDLILSIGDFKIYSIHSTNPSESWLDSIFYAIRLHGSNHPPIDIGLVGIAESDREGILQRIRVCHYILYHALKTIDERNIIEGCKDENIRNNLIKLVEMKYNDYLLVEQALSAITS